MTPRSIYLRAAEMVDSKEIYYSCCAISRQSISRPQEHYALYRYRLAFKEHYDPNFWLYHQTPELAVAERRELRVLMLLFAAAGCCDGLVE